MDRRPGAVELLEVRAEDFHRGGEFRLRGLSELYPIVLRSTQLSPGTPGPVDPTELGWLDHLVTLTRPLWVCETAGFHRTRELDLGWPAPVRRTGGSVAVLADHLAVVAERCGRLLAVEPVTSRLAFPDQLTEQEFLNLLCEQSGCRLVIDLSHLGAGAALHGFDVRAWLQELEPEFVIQYRLGGGTERRGEDAWVWQATLDVLAWALERTAPRAVVLDQPSGPGGVQALEVELRQVGLAAGARAS